VYKSDIKKGGIKVKREKLQIQILYLHKHMKFRMNLSRQRLADTAQIVVGAIRALVSNAA
jgi:hypothetical protein